MGFLDILSVPGKPGRYRPLAGGMTPEGETAALGFSCFALKIVYSLDRWEGLSEGHRSVWIDFIRSFQKVADGTFVDPVVIGTLEALRPPFRRRLLDRVMGRPQPSWARETLLAETKQAVATLAQVGEQPTYPVHIPALSPAAIGAHLGGLDWNRPWAAGGQAAALIVPIVTLAEDIVGAPRAQELRQVCSDFLGSVLDEKSGAYFLGEKPLHGELINGAMKVLTALDWLDVPPHRPEKLIDSCLAEPPSPEGCHLVDALYVLHRCARYTGYKSGDIARQAEKILRMIQRHEAPGGGFSYYVGAAQKNYYGVPISDGRDAADIHGTCLLTWAVAMAVELLGGDPLGWQVIRP